MRTLPDVKKVDKGKKWRLGTVYRTGARSYRYARAGADLKNHRAVKLGDTLNDLWVVSYANDSKEVYSATELSVRKGEAFWLRDPDGFLPFSIEVAHNNFSSISL